ncbi:MAG: DNA polymerase I [Chloroflexi bacterium]|nr:DNA polymerase I [Chloroflexota bacterium]
MPKKLFLLDGMALVYRAHFALISRPIFTSKGVNTSALYGFTQTLLEIMKNQKPTHLAVVFDTEAPTQRHKDFPEYKAQRQAMPEDLSLALPHVRRMVEAFNMPVIACDGYEADDLIGTLVRRAEKEGFESYMVTPDKDFGQLVSERSFLFKPARMGDAVEIMGVPEVLNKWGIRHPAQVIDVIGLWGDASDNIPGVPGIGEKTAVKLIAQYGSVENLLAHTNELKGKLKETLESFREQALLSKRLATILCDAPCSIDLESLEVRPPNHEQLKSLLIEFEFNSLGRRLFGDDFKAGRGFGLAAPESQASLPLAAAPEARTATPDKRAAAAEPKASAPQETPMLQANLKTMAEVPHDYRIVDTAQERSDLMRNLTGRKSLALAVNAMGDDPKQARLVGISFAAALHTGFYIPLPNQGDEAADILTALKPVLENEQIEKVGHDLKFCLSVLKWQGISVRGKLFDTMLAHSLIEPEMRHTLAYLAEVYLGYSPVALDKTGGLRNPPPLDWSGTQQDQAAQQNAERADLVGQLRAVLEPLLQQKGQGKVFYDVEAPLLPVLVDMEFEGIRLDAAALAEFADQLSKEMAAHEKAIHRLAGREFNLNSPKQLGEILFEELKISSGAKKTKTGQYATDEQTLLALSPDHEIVRRLLEFREMSKLKSTYADALPAAVWPATGRLHTTYHQAATATGRLNSQNPNLQNIPIRSEQGKEIRKAFVARAAGYLLLSADYSQIELRIIAALSHETAMLEAFQSGVDIHTATAARVYGVFLEMVTPEMRRKAKMVNYGIAYGISAFGLAQRLGISRQEAGAIIDQYFAQFPGIRKYMSDTIAVARQQGYVETITGRRRYLRDISSSNATVRAAAERNAINAPIQGTAADMIKIAMTNIHRELSARNLKTRMLLQVHDELVFDLYEAEKDEVLAVIEEKMKTAIPLDVPIVVEMGLGKNWLEAH